MVLPVIATHVSQLPLLNRSATDVYCYVFVLMRIFQELSYRVNGIPIKLLDS